jgi:hypothetical protein
MPNQRKNHNRNHRKIRKFKKNPGIVPIDELGQADDGKNDL